MSAELDELKELILVELMNDSTENPEEFLKRMESMMRGEQLSPAHIKPILKFENQSNNPNPEYQKDGDSGFDLRANLKEPITLKPLHRTLVPTGLFFEIPKGFEIQIRPKSGMSLKYGITVLNTPGTVDNLYRGEIQIITINLGQEDFIIEHGMRIAQAVLSPVVTKSNIDMVQIDKISTDTERGSDGFGSTGID